MKKKSFYFRRGDKNTYINLRKNFCSVQDGREGRGGLPRYLRQLSPAVAATCEGKFQQRQLGSRQEAHILKVRAHKLIKKVSIYMKWVMNQIQSCYLFFRCGISTIVQ